MGIVLGLGGGHSASRFGELVSSPKFRRQFFTCAKPGSNSILVAVVDKFGGWVCARATGDLRGSDPVS